MPGMDRIFHKDYYCFNSKIKCLVNLIIGLFLLVIGIVLTVLVEPISGIICISIGSLYIVASSLFLYLVATSSNTEERRARLQQCIKSGELAASYQEPSQTVANDPEKAKV